MNRTLFAAALAGAALAATAASAQDANWYVRGEAGANFQSKVDGTPDAKGDTGWNIGAAAGRDFGNGFRTEAEVDYFDASGKHDGGDLKTVAGFVNGYYDFNRGGAWQPFVGAGVGIAQVKVDGGLNDGDDTGFAWQLKAGVAHPFNDRLTGEIAYRYLGVTDVKFGGGVGGGIDGDYKSQAVTVGLRYKLGL